MSWELIVDSYRNYLLNFKQFREIPLKKPRPAKKVWVPPAVESLKKLLWVIFEEYDEAGFGVVIRNSHNIVVVALSERILKPSTMVILEMLVARLAIQFVQEIGLHWSIRSRCYKKKKVILHTKSLLYYFITSFYNISFIKCSIIQFYTLK